MEEQKTEKSISNATHREGDSKNIQSSKLNRTRIEEEYSKKQPKFIDHVVSANRNDQAPGQSHLQFGLDV